MSMDLSRPPVAGDYVYTSWGYDQTNVTFYRIVGFTPSGKSIRVQQVATHRDPFGSQERVIPLDVPATVRTWDEERTEQVSTPAPVKTVRWQHDHAKVDGHHAWLWDGKPEYATAPGWGH